MTQQHITYTLRGLYFLLLGLSVYFVYFSYTNFFVPYRRILALQRDASRLTTFFLDVKRLEEIQENYAKKIESTASPIPAHNPVVRRD